ncbi:DUF669 domain-containing protein [Ligilactobacillus animalis]|uniref:DUF669 domain-containing protein n=1 Tax=Ligilactobacillus animalis TaxID=1605 RepID=UPI0026E10A7A|nr:DUF669 domain-containing protein [Ligilactobacillus animalis]MDO5884177.1 DUF669 domain-containing protein [Ligilactobacillus animalis]
MAFKGFTVDHNNVLGRQVEEAGTYNVKILPTSEAKKSSAGNDMLTLNYEVTDGKYVGGQIRFDNIVWTDDTPEKEAASVKRFNTLATAVGAPDGATINTIQQLLGALTNKELNVTVEWGEPDERGNVYLRVSGHKPKDPEGSKPNGVFRPAKQQANSNFGANNQTSANTTDNFGTDPFAGAGQVISDDNLPF